MRPALCVACQVLLTSLLARGAWAAEADRLEALERKVEEQAALLEQQGAALERLEARLAQLEARQAPPEAAPAGAAGATAPTAPTRVDLEPDELPVIPQEQAASGEVLAREWFRNLRVGGFGAAGYAWTGKRGTKPHGGFLDYEAALDVDAQVWKDVYFVHELETVRIGEEADEAVLLGELHVDFKDVLQTFGVRHGRRIGLKLGRADIPYGEDYLLREAVDNPLITLPAAGPYGLDEGAVVYGKLGGLGWIGALMDGQNGRAVAEEPGKFVSLKLYGQPSQRLYLSASAFRSGPNAASALELAGTNLRPVGADGLVSSAGSSPSSAVDAAAYEIDARYGLEPGRSIAAQFGQVFLDDEVSEFDRTLYYFKLEPRWELGSLLGGRWSAAGRFSALGTFDDERGYAMEGEPFSAGAELYGYDAKALYRWAAGLGYAPNEMTSIKLEYSVDDFRTIERFALEGEGKRQGFFGLLVATRF